MEGTASVVIIFMIFIIFIAVIISILRWLFRINHIIQRLDNIIFELKKDKLKQKTS